MFTGGQRRRNAESFLMSLPNLTLVLGGAASGKSAYAEILVNSQDCLRTYIATAQAFDAEMKAKISAHRRARGAGWVTVEAPVDVAGAVADVPDDHCMLIDCATLWLGNLLHREAMWDDACTALIAAIGARSSPVIVVSNEVGHGIVPDNRLARQFRNAQGLLNQRLAAQAGVVVMVTAGLPMALKGKLP